MAGRVEQQKEWVRTGLPYKDLQVGRTREGVARLVETALWACRHKPPDFRLVARRDRTTQARVNKAYGQAVSGLFKTEFFLSRLVVIRHSFYLYYPEKTV